MIKIVAVLSVLIGLIVIGLPQRDDLPGETVKILANGGHGSGVHIGGGRIVTAAHVVGDAESVDVKMDDGAIVTADVIWSDTQYDVALVQISHELMVAALSCREPRVDEAVTARGNPLLLEFITTRGYVAGGGRQAGPWKYVVPVDITILMGMSGGPVFDGRGSVIGINIGVLQAPTGFGASVTGIGLIVPSSVICYLLTES